MQNILILGAGTAGTIMANRLHKRLDASKWNITIVNRNNVHYYQPGFLFIPFGIYEPEQVIKTCSEFLPKGVHFIQEEIRSIDAANNTVLLDNNSTLPYDYLIVATGVDIHPEETEGMKDGGLWHKDIFDFYTFEGSVALSERLNDWEGGRLVINIAEMPIKCPVAPLEFTFLADAYFTKKGIRDKVEIIYVTPLSGAFTKPAASVLLGDMLVKRNINVVPDFSIGRVDNDNKTIVSWDEREVAFDILVSVPTNKGDAMLERSNLGDEFSFLPINKHTLRSEKFPNIFAIGDTTNAPASKAGSVAHFEAEILTDNLLAAFEGKDLPASYDGHANCFVETGYEKGMLIDFSYDVEPLPGTFPFPNIGPMKLLGESHFNHYGKIMFRWVYWYMLLTGRDIPLVPAHFSMAGKKLQAEKLEAA